MNILNKFVAGLALGVAAGAAVAMFLQTEKGKEILSDIKDAAEDAGSNLRSNLKNFESEMNDLIKKGKKFVEDLEQKAKGAASSL
jgi:gas vesicle protein